jgi:hypothetical protein
MATIFPKTKKQNPKKCFLLFLLPLHLFSSPCVSIVIERKRGELLYRRADGVSLVLSLPPFMPRCFPTLESGSRLDTFFSIANGESTISHGAHNGGHNGSNRYHKSRCGWKQEEPRYRKSPMAIVPNDSAYIIGLGQTK